MTNIQDVLSLEEIKNLSVLEVFLIEESINRHISQGCECSLKTGLCFTGQLVEGIRNFNNYTNKINWY